MKTTIVRFGLYSALFEFIFFVLTWLVIDITHMDPGTQGALGMVNLLCPLVFVYFGIRYYRDRINDGQLGFLQAIKIGLFIVAIPAVSYAIVESVYVLVIDPKFYAKIGSYDIELYRKTLSPAVFAAKVKEIKQQLVIDNNPFYNFTVITLMVGALGTIVTLISALLLFRRENKVVAIS